MSWTAFSFTRRLSTTGSRCSTSRSVSSRFILVGVMTLLGPSPLVVQAGDTLDLAKEGAWLDHTIATGLFTPGPDVVGANLALVKVCDPDFAVGEVVTCWIMPVNLNEFDPVEDALIADILPSKSGFAGSYPRPDFRTIGIPRDRIFWFAPNLPPALNLDCYYEYLNWVVDPFAGPFDPQLNPVCSGDLSFEAATIYYISYRPNSATLPSGPLVNTAAFSGVVPGFERERLTASYVTWPR